VSRDTFRKEPGNIAGDFIGQTRETVGEKDEPGILLTANVHASGCTETTLEIVWVAGEAYSMTVKNALLHRIRSLCAAASNGNETKKDGHENERMKTGHLKHRSNGLCVFVC